MMLNFATTLGINLPKLGKQNPLITPLRLYRESQIPVVQLNQITPLDLPMPLIQTSRLLATNSTDRLHHNNQQSEIGWDNWQPIDRPLDRDDFDYKVDRSRFNLTDRSSQIDEVENPELDFFTTVLPTEFAELDPQPDSLPTNSIDVEIPTPTNKDRSTADTVRSQLPVELQPKSVDPDLQLLDSNQINQIKQPKLSAHITQVSANIQLSQILQSSSGVVGDHPILPESLVALSLDNFALKTPDDSLPEPAIETSSFATETSTNINLDISESPDSNLTQISKFTNETATTSALSPELIPDSIIPNLHDTPTTVNPVAPPKVAVLEPIETTAIAPESAVSPEILTPFTVPEQIATATGIAPIPEPLDRLTSDPIAPNSPDLPTIIDPQQPTSITTQPPLLNQKSLAAEDTPPIVQSAVEPTSESISGTLPVNLSDSLIINQSPSTDPAQIGASLDELVIANLDAPAFPSNLTTTTSPLSADLGQNDTVPDRIPPEIQSPQLLNPDTLQLNLAADRDNIDRELNPSIQLEPANSNIPESPSKSQAEPLPTHLLPDPNPEQIATSLTPLDVDVQFTQLVTTDTSQLNLLNPTSVNQAFSVLEQISTPAEETTPENLESLPIPIIESSHALSVNLDPTIEFIPTLNLDSPQFKIDRSILEDIPIASTEIGEVDRENTIEAGNDFDSKNLLTSPLSDRSFIDRTIVNSPQNNNQLEYLSVTITDISNDIVSPVNNPVNNLTNVIQIDSAIAESPTIDSPELPLRSIDPPDDNLANVTVPAPTAGYATGGYVKDANHIDLQSIATSDTVSAMLTPGEFVINAKDAQKNLDLLTHINRGGEPESALSNPETQPSTIESLLTSPDISPTSIQRKPNDSLVSPSLQRDIGLQQLSPLTNPGLDTFESSQTESSNSPPTYSSPSMIFRKPMLSSQSQYIGSDTPNQWESIEDLMSGSSNNSDPFSFDRISPQQPDLESRLSPSLSPTSSPQYASPTRGFADGGEVTPSDISTTIEPITQTIESPLANSQPQPANNDPAELEILAREIYHRLRQRLEIERERHGSYSGNLAW